MSRFSDKTVLVLLAMFCVAIAGVLWLQHRLHQQLVRSTSREQARRLATALETFRTLYTSEVVARLRDHDIKVTHDYDSERNRGHAIPLPATLSMKLGNELGAKLEGGEARLYSAYPFPYPGRDGLSDQFELDAWEELTKNPDKPFERIEEVNGKSLLRYAIADRMRSTCVDCHNSHPESPKTDWREGDVRGILEVALSLGAAEEQASANLRESFFLLAGVGGIGLLGLVVVIRRLRRTSVELEQRVQLRTAELEQTAQALRRREAQSRSLISSSPAALIMVNRSGDVVLMNQQAEFIFGYRQDELIGQSIELLVPEYVRDVHPQLREQFFQAPSPRAVGEGRNLCGVRKDGIEIPIDIGLMPVETDEGLAVIVAAVDLALDGRPIVVGLARHRARIGVVACEDHDGRRRVRRSQSFLESLQGGGGGLLPRSAHDDQRDLFDLCFVFPLDLRFGLDGRFNDCLRFGLCLRLDVRARPARHA